MIADAFGNRLPGKGREFRPRAGRPSLTVISKFLHYVEKGKSDEVHAR